MTLSLQKALDLDASGDGAALEEIQTTLSEAIEAEPDNLYLRLRYVNHLAFTGSGPRKIETAITDTLDNFPVSEGVAEKFVVPVADIQARLGEISSAWQLLEKIPVESFTSSAEELKRQLEKMFLVEEGHDVVSWERLGDGWYEQPPIALPDVYQGRVRADNWIAGKLGAKDTDQVTLRVGAVTRDEVKYGWMHMEYSHWLEIGGQELPDFEERLPFPGTAPYWEIGSYGEITRVYPVETQGFRYALPDPAPAPWRFRFR